MIGVSTSPFNISMLRRFNTWYSVKDGNWSDPAIWLSNGRKKHSYPQAGDDVYIHHNVACDAFQPSLRNLYVNGTLQFKIFNNNSLTVTGDIQASGTIDQSLVVGHILILNGVNNSMANYIPGTSGTINYSGFFEQPILPLSYCNLITGINGKKYLSVNTTISGTLNVFGSFECGSFDLTVNGQTTITNNANYSFNKSGPGNLLFKGLFYINNSSVDFSGGNPNVELQNGIAFNAFAFFTGTGTFKFTTNNQTIQAGALNTGAWTAPILISGAITVSNDHLGLVSPNAFAVYSVINGDNALSTFNNNKQLLLANSTTPMATGVFNYKNASGSQIGYVFNGNYTLPYTSYDGLVISGTGTKSLGGNTVCQTLVINSNFECGSFDLTVSGQTNCKNGSVGIFSKSGSGNLLFKGFFDANTGNSTIDWTGGNPNVEFQNGASFNSFSLKTGTGTFKFTTNNQTLRVSANNTGSWTAPILISGTITLTNTSSVTVFDVFAAINGDNVASTFLNSGFIIYRGAIQPMAIGVLQTNTVTNTFLYSLAGNQDITPGIYRNLTLAGSGAKRLLGNVSAVNTYTLTSPATLNTNGFALTNP